MFLESFGAGLAEARFLPGPWALFCSSGQEAGLGGL